MPALESALDGALSLAAQRFLVLPLHSITDGACTCGNASCTSPGKHPRTRQGFKDASTDEAQVRTWWATWPGANVGLRTGEESGIWVLDVDAKSGGLETLVQIKQKHGEDWMGPTVRTGGGGLHSYYRWPTGGTVVRSRTNVWPGIDVRGAGGYVVAPPSVGLHQAYEWEGDGRLILEAPAWLLEGVVSQQRAPAAGAGSPDAVVQVDSDLADDLRSALAHLGTASDDYETWVKFGHALRPLGAAGFGLWAWWSSFSMKFDPRACREKWERDLAEEPESIGYKSIFYQARELGWRNPGSTRDPELRDIEAEEQPDLEWTPAPAHLLDPPGLVGDLARWVLSASVYPQPVAALAASLTSLGALYGRRYATPTNLRTNLYCVVLGDTGAGKDGPRALVAAAFDAAGLGHLVGGEAFASAQGIYGALIRQPSQVFMLDEFGELLEGITRERAPEYLRKIAAALMTLHSSAGGRLRGAEYASAETERADILEPHACILGTSTPESFYRALGSQKVVDGFLNRMVVLRLPALRPAKVWPDSVTAPAALLEELQRHHDVGAPGGNVGAVTGDGPVHSVPFTADAKTAVDTFELNVDTRGGIAHRRSLWVRAAAEAQKIALVLAVGRDPQSPVVEAADIEWALDLVTWGIRNLEHQLHYHLADTTFERLAKRLLKVVVATGPKGASKQLLAKQAAVSRRQRDEALDFLLESGKIQKVTLTTGRAGRPGVAYVALVEVSS